MSGFTSENELLNSEIAAHTGSYDRTGKDSYAPGKLVRVEIYYKGALEEQASTEKEAEEIIKDFMEEDEAPRSDYITKIIYE